MTVEWKQESDNKWLGYSDCVLVASAHKHGDYFAQIYPTGYTYMGKDHFYARGKNLEHAKQLCEEFLKDYPHPHTI